MTAPRFVPDDDALLRRLRALDPVARGGVPELGFDLRAHLDAITAEPASTKPRRRIDRPRRGWRISVAAVVGLVCIGGVATAVTLVARRSDVPEAGVTCRVTPDLRASSLVLRTDDDPIEACGTAWADGRLRPLGGGAAIPEQLTACVGPSQAVDVFPAGPDVCARLGLAPALIEEAVDPVVELQNQLAVATVDTCVSLDTTADLAQSLLDRLGLAGWTIVVQPGQSGTDRCARIGVDSTTRTVVLVPGPPP